MAFTYIIGGKIVLPEAVVEGKALAFSEETGKISMAVNGELMREIDPVYLKRKLEEYMIPEKTEPKVSKIFGKGGEEEK